MGFRALRAARTPGISTFLYMHGPSLSGHWYPALRAATTADPDDLPVNGPFLADDSLLLFSQPNAKPSQSSDGGAQCHTLFLVSKRKTKSDTMRLEREEAATLHPE